MDVYCQKDGKRISLTTEIWQATTLRADWHYTVERGWQVATIRRSDSNTPSPNNWVTIVANVQVIGRQPEGSPFPAFSKSLGNSAHVHISFATPDLLLIQ